MTRIVAVCIVIGLLLLVLLIFWAGSYFKTYSKRPPAPNRKENGWTNTAIRKQGKDGKGIR